MKGKGPVYDEYYYISEEDIIKACSGESRAMGTVANRYWGYTKQYIISVAAREKHIMDLRNLPMEDLIHSVWEKVILVITKKFKI